jgi:hypothetical protein
MQVIDLATKVINTDEDDATISFKVIIKNDSDDEITTIEIKGFDEEGFEITSVLIFEEIEAGETKTLTAREHVCVEDFEQITEWRVK